MTRAPARAPLPATFAIASTRPISTPAAPSSSTRPSHGGSTITLTHGELEINVNTTITNSGGAGSLTISGGNTFRVFNITSNTATVGITGLTIADGNASPAIGQLTDQGGDIINAGNLTLTNDIVQKGTVAGTIGGPTGFGGGIFNESGSGSGTGATLILDGTTVTGNTAKGFGGGAGAMGEGGGIFNDTNATVTLKGGSTVSSNQALGASSGNAEGGGIFNSSGGTLILQGTSALPIAFTSNLAKGGDGNSAVGTPLPPAPLPPKSTASRVGLALPAPPAALPKEGVSSTRAP